MDNPHPMYKYFGEEPPAVLEVEEPLDPVTLLRQLERLEGAVERARAKLKKTEMDD